MSSDLWEDTRKLAEHYRGHRLNGVKNSPCWTTIYEATIHVGLPEDAPVSQRFYHVLNDLHTPVMCSCGTPVRWNHAEARYRTYCSRSCPDIQKVGTKGPRNVSDTTKALQFPNQMDRHGLQLPTVVTHDAAVIAQICKTILDNNLDTGYLSKSEWCTALTSVSGLPVTASTRQHVVTIGRGRPICHCGSPVRWGGSEYLEYCGERCRPRNFDTAELISIAKRVLETCMLPSQAWQREFARVTPYLDDRHGERVSMVRRAWHILNGPTIPRCPTCNVDIKWLWDKGAKAYPPVCGNTRCWDDDVRKQIKETRLETNMSRTGIPNPMKNPENLSKRTKTTIARYGRPSASEAIISDKVWAKITDPDWLREQHHSLGKSLTLLSKELGYNSTGLSKRMRAFGIDIISVSVSEIERQLADTLRSKANKLIETSTFKIIPPLQLDIWIPDCNIAVEVNGMYWHSEEIRGRRYHINKTVMCDKRGIRLLHIFEYELIRRFKQIARYILVNLGSYNVSNTNASVLRVGRRNAYRFYQEWGVDGSTSGEVNTGVVVNDKLVACMSATDGAVCGYVATSLIGGVHAATLLAPRVNPNVWVQDRRFLYPDIGMKTVETTRPRRLWYCESEAKDTGIYTDAEVQDGRHYRCFWDCGVRVLMS